jgi:hypothetical protein
MFYYVPNEAEKVKAGHTESISILQTRIEVGPDGSEHEVTYYSDDSYSVDFGGLIGKKYYSKYGKEY